MDRNTKLDKKYRKEAVKLLRKLQGSGYDSVEITGFMLAAIESVCPDVSAGFENGEMVVSGSITTH